MKYQIYFRVFNRKMQVTIEANSPADADKKLRRKIQDKIQIDKVEPIEAKMPEMPEQFKEIFSNIFGGGK